METTNTNRLKLAMGIQTAIYLLLAALYSLPGWSEWLQDKLNFVSTNLLNTTAAFTEHSLFQAGAFVLVLFMACYTARVFLDPTQAGARIPTLLSLNFAYSLSGLMFYIFSHTRMFHDLFAFLFFGGLGVWTAVVYFKRPKVEQPAAPPA